MQDSARASPLRQLRNADCGTEGSQILRGADSLSAIVAQSHTPRAATEKFLPLFPGSVIELRSPGDMLATLQAKMEEYVANGCRLGWLVDPNRTADMDRVDLAAIRQNTL
jgi:hypothetical protein